MLIQISKEETSNNNEKKTKMRRKKHIFSKYSLIYWFIERKGTVKQWKKTFEKENWNVSVTKRSRGATVSTRFMLNLSNSSAIW